MNSERNLVDDVLIDEIRQQPEAVKACAAGLPAQAEAFSRLRGLVTATPIVLTGMGSSFDAAEALASRLCCRGLIALAVNAAELLHFRLAMLRPGSMVMAISQSGESAELVQLAERLGRADVRLVAVTNAPESTLARCAEVSLQLGCGPEFGPSTKSIQATMIVLAVLEELLASSRPVAEVIETVSGGALLLAETISGLLRREDEIVSTLRAWLGSTESVWLLSRGQGMATAEIAALVLKEAGQLAAGAMDAGEFRHGPLELAGPRLAVAVVSVEPAVRRLEDGLLAELASHGTSVIQIGGAGSRPWPVVELPAWGSLLDAGLAVVPFQLLTWSLARERTPQPGRFAKGSKTTTKE